MKKMYEYSHFGGAEILQVHYPQLVSEIDRSIASVKAERTKVSKEKGKTDKLMFDPKAMNKSFEQAFRENGWQQMVDRYTIELPDYPTKIKGAFKQIDFVKDHVFVEVQFGEYPSVFYDMSEFQYFFDKGEARVGVEIVPANILKRQMSSGVSYGEQLIYDIERLDRHFPAVPIKVILIDRDDAPPPPAEIVEEKPEEEADDLPNQ
jgi:restriction endonuclease BglII